MKIIFLDIDGVLNNMKFYTDTNMKQGPFDEKSVKCLVTIVKESAAKIVLTSSWRGGWDQDPAKCHEEGRLLNEMLHKEGISIMDKTGIDDHYDGSSRSREIKSWIKKCPEKIEGFVIIDDGDFLWAQNGLASHWLKTDFMELGLSENHIAKALSILDQGPEKSSIFSKIKKALHI